MLKEEEKNKGGNCKGKKGRKQEMWRKQKDKMKEKMIEEKKRKRNDRRKE